MTGAYKIGTLSRLTGFSPAVLRAWERRFTLLQPERGTGRHRLYTDDDLKVLRQVRVLMDAGRSIGEIVRPGREALLASVAGVAARLGREDARRPFSGAGDWQQRTVAAALALDARAVSATIDDAFAALAPERAIDELIVPVALEVGRLWEAGTCSVASEHLVSDQFLHRVRRLVDAAQPADDGAPAVLAACFPGEQHQLGLAILSWHLARRGVRVVYLGAALPLADLSGSVPRSRCRAVLLSVTRRSVFNAHYPSIVEYLSSGPPVFVGGQGVPDGRNGKAHGVVTLRDASFHAAVDRIVSEVGRPGQPRGTSAKRS